MDPEHDPSQPAPVSGPAGPIRVLYLRREGRSSEKLVNQLEEVGDAIDVVVKSDPKAGLEYLRSALVDCVLCTGELRTDSSIDPLEELRQIDAHLPFILLRDESDEPFQGKEQSGGITDSYERDGSEESVELLANGIERAVEQYRNRRGMERERAHRTAIFENTPDPIVRVRFYENVPEIVAVNPCFEQVFGFEEDAVIGRKIRDVIVPESEHEEHLSFREDIMEGRSVEAEVRRQTNDGIREFKLRVVPAGEFEGALDAYALYTDITEQKRYETRLERLNEASQRLLRATTDQEVADITVDITTQVLAQPLTSVWAYNTDMGVLEPLAASQAASDLKGSHVSGRGLEQIGSGTAEMDIFEEGAITAIEDYGAIDDPADADMPLGTVLVAPLGNRGLLRVGSRTVGSFADSTRDLVEILCQNAEGALERVHRERTLSELTRLTSDLVRSSSPAEIARLAAEAGSDILSLPYSHVYLKTDDGEALEPAAMTDATKERFGELPRFERGEGLFWDVLSAGEIRHYDNVQSDVELASDLPFRSAVIAPLGDRGVFASGSLQPSEFDEFDRELASILATTILVAIERSEREERLRDREQALERARDRFRSIFEQSNDAIVIFDPVADEILEANARASELLGYSRDQLRSMGPSDIHPTELEEFRAFLDTIQTEGSGHTDRLSCLTASGESVPAEISASTLDFMDRDSILALIRDVSELRAYERELERKNDRLEDFAEIISHDLRNPLNVAMGHVELALEKDNDDNLESAKSALARMEQMIGDLLAFARAGEAIEETMLVDLGKLVDGCWNNVDTQDGSIEAPEDLRIQADESRLRHVLENLFRNAIEHGGSDVTIRVGRLDDRSGFYVEDDGPGISPANRDTVFQRGYSGAEDGTGFGLSIVKEIVEAHDWEITVTDGMNGGARFEISGVEIE